MCGKGSQTQTSSSAPDPQAMALYQQLLTRAQGVAGTPYTPYTGDLVAPVNAQQSQGIAGVNNAAGFALPNVQQALTYANNAAQPITAGQIQQYTNPYTQNVVNATQAQFNNQNQQQLQGVRGNAIAQGALGGNREAIAESELANQQQLAQAPVLAGLRSSGYQQGVGTALAEQAAMGQGAYSVGNLGVAGENAGLTGANAQIGAGTLQQQTQQQQLAAQYQQFLNQQAYPFQTTQWLAGLGTGVGSQMGGTSQTTSPAPSLLGQIFGGVAGGAGILGSTGAFGSSGWLAPAFAALKTGGAVRQGVAGSEEPDGPMPEPHETLLAQQHQLRAGHRRAQMFPHGTPELPLPQGMQRTVSHSGVFHHNPQHLSADAIHAAAHGGRENDVLDLGPYSKHEIWHRVQNGEHPIAVVERTPEGTEVRAAAGTTHTVPHQLAAMHRTKSPGHTVSVEELHHTLGRRSGSIPHRDSGGSVNTGPYTGGNGWVPNMGIVHGSGPPRPPGLPNQQQNGLAGDMKNIGALANSISSGMRSGSGLGDDGLGSVNDPTWTGGTPLEGSPPIGFGGIGSARRGGVVGYAGGGDTTPDFDARFNGVSPADFDSRFSGDIGPTLPKVPLGDLPGNGFGDAPAPAVSDDSAPNVPLPQQRPSIPTQGVAPVQEAVAQPREGLVPATYSPEASVAVPAPTATALPRGLRNNNPGNIEDGAFARSQPGYKGSDGRFAIFATPEAGINAQSNLLGSYGAKGINTLSGIINRWAPAADNNNTQAYIAAVSKMTGLDPNQPLDMADPNLRLKVASAISKYENGNVPTDALLARNYNRAAGVGTDDSVSIPPKAQLAQRQGVAGPDIDWSGNSKLWPALMAAGFGMMASRSPFAGVAIGEGAQQGLQTYAAEKQLEATHALSQRKIDLEAQKLSQEADRWSKDYALKALPYQGAMTAQQKAKLEEEQRQHAIENLKPVQIGTGPMGPIYAVRDGASGGYRVIDSETGLPGKVIGAPAAPGAPPAPASGASPLPVIPNQTSPGQPILQSVTVQPTDPNKFAPPELIQTAFGQDDVAAPLRTVFDADARSTEGMNLKSLDEDPNVAKDPGLRNRILAVASGRAPIPPTTGRASYLNQFIAKKAYEVNPMLDGTTFQRRQRTENFYAVGTQGGGGQNIVAINRWLAHSGSLLALAEKMNMGDYTTFNDLKNTLASRGLWTKDLQDQLGAWEVNAQGVAGEAAKVFAGSNTALADRQEWLKVLSPSTPLHTIRAKLQQAADMGAQALAANVANYNEGMRTNHSPREFLTPRSRQILDALEKGQTVSSIGGQAPTQPGTTAPAAPAVRPVPSDTDIAYARAHPEVHDKFVQRFGREP